MIDKEANPFVVDFNGFTQFQLLSLGHLSNLPSKKSVFFTTRSFEGGFEQKISFQEPWFYRNGVLDGKFGLLIGQGATGSVISGEWFGKKAAFKFVEVGKQKFQAETKDSLETLDDKLSEMISIQSTTGSKIVNFYGHYR